MQQDPLHSIGAVILTHGEDTRFRGVLQGLIEQGLSPAALCVVHNPVSQHDRPIVPPHPDIHTISTSRNVGYTGGMNIGIRHHLAAGKAWVWVITNDLHLRPGAVAALAQAGAAHPEYGALGPVLIIRDTTTVFSLGGQMDAVGAVSHAGAGASEASLDDSHAGVTDCAWLDGASVMLNATALRQCGAFDERFFIYCEDCDLCWRLRTAGWKVGVANAARAEQTSGFVNRPGVHAYLITRNSLALRKAVGGKVAVRHGVYYVAKETMKVVCRLASGRYSRDERRRRMASVAGNVLGLMAYSTNRWGAPPSWLPGAGDTRPKRQPEASGRPSGAS